jgi:hypothetical protein
MVTGKMRVLIGWTYLVPTDGNRPGIWEPLQEGIVSSRRRANALARVTSFEERSIVSELTSRL